MESNELINLIADLKKIEDINLIKQAVNSCLTVQQLKKRFLQDKSLLTKDNF